MKCHSSPSAPARSLRAAGLLTVAGLALTACGGGDGDDGQVELSFVWWGSDARHQNTQEIIDAFEAEHPDISINPTFSEWDGYWDTLATQTAGGDSPDIIQMDELYLREYADRGALLDLTEVDLSNFEDTVVESGQTEEGQFGVTIGINAATMLANPDLFDEAGVGIPDDETWTWGDYHQTASELSEGLEDAWGSGNFDETLGFQAWTRQHGEHLSDAEGQLGFTPETAASYFQFFLDMMQDGAAPSASAMSEDQAVSPDQSMTTTGQVAMRPWWSNQAVALTESSGAELQLLRMPTVTGEPEGAEPWYKSSMYLSAAADTDHPEEAQEFIDFFVNSEEAARIDMAERGMPPNQELRELITEELEGPEERVAEYIENLGDDLGEAEPVPAMGGSAFPNILYRYHDEVLFERMTPDEAGEAMHAEMEDEIGG